MELTDRQARRLKLQTLVDRLAFPIFGTLVVAWMRWVRGYRLSGMRAVRRVFDQAARRRRPVIICANHLTMVDSLLIHHALSSLVRMMVDFRRLSWNVPAIENFQQSRGLRLVTYLGKTIPIDRAGSPEHHREVLDKLTWLVEHGDTCTLFPEGGRSRTGRVDTEQVTYGVGQILMQLEDPLVVCVYVRGEQQRTWSDLPARGDQIHVEATALEPRTEQTGLRGARDLSRQIILELARLEGRYLESRGKGGEQAASLATGRPATTRS